MSITKEIRTSLAAQVTVKAISKHADKFNTAVAELNAKFSEVHCEYIKKLLPELPTSRWNDLIQAGVLIPQTRLGGNVRRARTDEHASANYVSSILGGYLGSRATEEGLVGRLCRELDRSGKWSTTLNTLSPSTRYISNYLQLGYAARYSVTMPASKNSNDVDLYLLEREGVEELAPYEKDRLIALVPLVDEAERISAEFGLLLEQALDYHAEVFDLLLACRTRKQLESVFPEAAALLPQPAPKRSEIVPAELAKNVRRRLVEGVPV